MSFTDLKELRNNMRKKEIAVFSTTYRYNGVNCYIAYCLLTSDEVKLDKYKYTILRMRFIKQNDFNDYIDCPANSNGLNVKHGELRRFFNIQYDNNGAGVWFNALITDISNNINTNIPNQTNELNNVSIDTVCRHENRNINRTYRSHLLRHRIDKNGNIKCRTEYNSQLAALKFPNLYNIYRNDKHVSFAFTDRAELEVSEDEAYHKFITLENTRKNN